MTGNERRKEIISILKGSDRPVPGIELASTLSVSRQVIVQDIALIRADKIDIVSTNRGYWLEGDNEVSRVFKVIHTDEEVEEELNIFVDNGGKVVDVFVYHKMYGVIKADMNIKSRLDVKNYIEGLKSGKSSMLKNVTSGYHYHTIVAPTNEILDRIQTELEEKGFLAKLQDYEPVDFWKK